MSRSSQAVKWSSNESPSGNGTDSPRNAVPLFRHLSSSDVADVFARGRSFEVSPKVRLCSAGQRANHFFLVLKGRIKYSRDTDGGDEIIIRLLTRFDCLGLASLLPDPPNYLGTAVAVFPSEVVVWRHADMVELATRYPDIRTNVLRIALEYFGALSERHSRLFEGDASHRIARVLMDMGRRSGDVRPDGIAVHITNEQLGSLADVNRFTTSRVLSDWSKRGVITKNRELVRIHSPEALLSDS